MPVTTSIVAILPIYHLGRVLIICAISVERIIAVFASFCSPMDGNALFSLDVLGLKE